MTSDKPKPSAKMVHQELYREYLVTVDLVLGPRGEDDPFELNLPDRYLPMINGQVIAGLATNNRLLGDAIVAAKRWVDNYLLHPLSGKSFTRSEREEYFREQAEFERDIVEPLNESH